MINFFKCKKTKELEKEVRILEECCEGLERDLIIVIAQKDKLFTKNEDLRTRIDRVQLKSDNLELEVNRVAKIIDKVRSK